MPEPFDLDTLKRALDEVPAPDLWREAERRAEGAAVLPLTGVGGRRRPVRWLAAAAVAALAVGSAVVLTSSEEDQGLDTANRRESGVPPFTIGEPEGCQLGLSIEPGTVMAGGELALRAGAASPPLFEVSQQRSQTVAHAELGDQVAELHVPGIVVRDLVGERVEQVELARGTADVWFRPEFVQVRWFAGGQEPCDSFSVTVAGGTEGANRQLAVELADHLVLGSDLEGPSLRQTEWQLERSIVDGTPNEGNGSTFRFRQNDVIWTDGCNEHRATFDQSWPSVLDLLGNVTSTLVDCPTDPTTQAISSVMRADPDREAPHETPSRYTIRVRYDGDLLILSAGNAVLTLRPLEG